VATQLIRGLQLGMAGRRSGDTINFWGQARYTTKTMKMMWMRPSPMQSVHWKTTYWHLWERPRSEATQTTSLSAREPKADICLVFAAVFDPDARLSAHRQQSCLWTRPL